MADKQKTVKGAASSSARSVAGKTSASAVAPAAADTRGRKHTKDAHSAGRPSSSSGVKRPKKDVKKSNGVFVCLMCRKSEQDAAQCISHGAILTHSGT